MCGIVGICNFGESHPISIDAIVKMANVLNHRGPDESGIYLDDWVGLGSARLSILDLSMGIQPIHNEDESLWIVYNGEIFNYLELRNDLKKRGHEFRTLTDTEVILHSYEEMGPSCLKLLNGQFSFAIWNNVKRELFLARDRVGIVPLFYAIRSGSLVFASEIKSIFMVDEIPRRMDPVGMDQIFTFWTTIKERTCFEGIQQLPPGHCLTAKGGNIEVRKYWDIPFCPPEDQVGWSVENILEALSDLITDAVRIRLRADVPVACYLSGGLDSSGVATLLKRNFNHPARTFGIRFEETAFDEGDYQSEMVSFLQTDHTEVKVKNEEIGSFLSNVLWHCESPLLRTAPVPLFLLSEVVAREGYKVALTGEGADEVFGGYNIFREAKVRAFWAKSPGSTFRPLLLQKLYPYLFKDKLKINKFMPSFFGVGLDKAGEPLFSHLVRWQNTRRIRTFFSSDLMESIGDYSGLDELEGNLPASFDRWDCLSKAQYLEMSIFMSNYLLSSQGDRVAMAHGVEVRPPYLDHRIIEFMGRVPQKWKISGLNEKYILKRLFRGILPERILSRPKQPYRAPIYQALLKRHLPPIEESISDKSLKGARLFDAIKVRKLVKKLQTINNASEFDSMALVGIVSSQILYEQFINHFPVRPVQPIIPRLIVDKRKLHPS